MSKASLSLVVFLNCALTLIVFHEASAQVTNDANRLYGQGVHAYFAGNSAQAEVCISSALELKTDDPRYYYFRALALLRMGRTAEARGDMLVGAQLESQHPNRFAVGTALERVQGADRLMLERFRRDARADAGLSTVEPPAITPGRVPTTTDSDAAVLRRKLMIPLEQFLQPGGPQPVLDDRTSPIALPQPTFVPATKPANSPENPFQDDPAPQPGTQPTETTVPAAVPQKITPPATPPPTPPSAEVEVEVPAAEAPAPKTPPVESGNPFDF